MITVCVLPLNRKPLWLFRNKINADTFAHKCRSSQIQSLFTQCSKAYGSHDFIPFHHPQSSTSSLHGRKKLCLNSVKGQIRSKMKIKYASRDQETEEGWRKERQSKWSWLSGAPDKWTLLSFNLLNLINKINFFMPQKLLQSIIKYHLWKSSSINHKYLHRESFKSRLLCNSLCLTKKNWKWIHHLTDIQQI